MKDHSPSRKKKDWINNSYFYCNKSIDYHQRWEYQKEQDWCSTLTLYPQWTGRTRLDGRKSQPFPITRWEWRQSEAEALHYTSCLRRRTVRGTELREKCPYLLWVVPGKLTGWVPSYWTAYAQSTVPGALEVPLTNHAWCPSEGRQRNFHALLNGDGPGCH